jgi:hypothetical protein
MTRALIFDELWRKMCSLSVTNRAFFGSGLYKAPVFRPTPLYNANIGVFERTFCQIDPMSDTHNNDKKLLQIIHDLVAIIGDCLCGKKDQKPVFGLSTIVNNQIYIMADISLVLGVNKTGLFTLTDNTSGVVITTAVFSNQAVGANSNPAAATFALDPTNLSHAIGTPVAIGTGTIVFTTDAQWTSLQDGTSQSGSFTVTKNYAVIASVSGVGFDVVFP